MFRALSIVHAAAIIGHVSASAVAIIGHVSASAADCYPNYASGKLYAIGEWSSASVLTSGFKTEGRFRSLDVYNFQCVSEGTMCSNDEYAPGSINSELAWTRDSTPCSMNQKEQAISLNDVESSADTSDTKSISRKLQVTTGPSTSQPTSPTNTPTAVPTPTATNIPQPTALPTSSKPTLVTNVPTSTGTPQPTANSTTALPTPVQLQTSSPTPRGATPSPTTLLPTPNPGGGTATSIPTPIPTPKPTPIPTSAKPFRPTRKPIMIIPRLPNQCQCPCSGSKASKQAKNSKSAAFKAGKTWTGRIYCTCPCTPVVVKPTCYRCRTHIGRIN